MTPTKLFVDQVEKARLKLGFSESDICVAAGVKSPNQIGRSRSGRTPMQWDHVAAIAEVLGRDYEIRREWLLWNEGEMRRSGALLRFGPGTGAIDPKPVRPGKGDRDAVGEADATPRAGKHRRRK
jgi:transcriptional regulator with XRE-family HTH domain